MSDDKRPSIAELRSALECVAEGCWTDARERLLNATFVLIEVVAAALAYRKAQKAAAKSRHEYYLRFAKELSPVVEVNDKEELRCRDAYEAALAKVRE